MKHRTNTLPSYLIQAETKALFSKVKSKRDSALFRLAYRHGLRASEVGLLQRADVDFETNRIKVKRLKGGRHGEYLMDRKTVRALKDYLNTRTDDDPTLFLSRNGGPLSRVQLHRLFQRYAAAADIDPDRRHFHCLRHSIGTHMVEAGEDIRVIQDWLGHKNIASTLIYAQVTNPVRDEAARRMERSGVIV